MFNGLFIASAISFAARERGAADAAIAKRASKEASAAQSKVTLLQLDVDKLLMITEALWNILKEHHGYSDQDLVDRIQEIDLRDGKLDGRVGQQQVATCPKCPRPLIGKHPICLYCGIPVKHDVFE